MLFLVLSLLITLGVVLEASAVASFWEIVVGRIIVYSGIGLASNVVPTYLSECSPPRVRGSSCLAAIDIWCGHI